MARPVKTGLDYFPLDCEWDSKLEKYLLEKEAIGLSVLITIWQIIYKNGFYIQYDEDLLLMVKKRINVAITEVNDCINSALRRDIFDKTLFDEYKILTSKAIQKRFFEAAKRKKQIFVVEEFLLCDVSEYQNLIFDSYCSNNSDNCNNNSDKCCNNALKLKLNKKLNINKSLKLNVSENGNEKSEPQTSNFQTSNSQTFFINNFLTSNGNELSVLLTEYQPKEFDEESCSQSVTRMLKDFCGIENPTKAEVNSFVNIILKTPQVKKSTAFSFVFNEMTNFRNLENGKRKLSYLYKATKGKLQDALTKAKEQRAKKIKEQEKQGLKNIVIPEINELMNKMRVN